MIPHRVQAALSPARVAWIRTAHFTRFRTSPNAFFIFCTLGSEMLSLAAIAAPVFPAWTIFFTRARIASLILAGRRGPLPFPAFVEPRGRPPRAPFAFRTATRNSAVVAKPYRSGRDANSFIRKAATCSSSCATSDRRRLSF
jgi:hypothetical protein